MLIRNCGCCATSWWSPRSDTSARAAERLGIAQPPLSQQIRKLETQLGAQLIDRSCRPIELTDAGYALLREGRLALVHGERAFAAARRAAAGQLGLLRIGAMQAAVNGVVPNVIRATAAITPTFASSSSRRAPPARSASSSRTASTSASYAGPSTSPPSPSTPSSMTPSSPACPMTIRWPAQLASTRRRWPHSHSCSGRAAQRPPPTPTSCELFRRHGVQPPVVDETTRIQTVLALVAAGVGIALLPTSFANLGRRGVRFIRLSPPLPHRPLVLAWRAGDPSPTLATFLAAARWVAPGYAKELQTLSSPPR